MENISQIEKKIWEVADYLQAHSKLTSMEYDMPVLGLIFLRHGEFPMEGEQGKNLILDVRGICQDVNDFSPHQLKNLAAITWLYEGETDCYLSLITEYLGSMATQARLVMENMIGFEIRLEQYTLLLKQFGQLIVTDENKTAKVYQPYLDKVWELVEANRAYEGDRTLLLQEIAIWLADYDVLPRDNEGQKAAYTAFISLDDRMKRLSKQIEQIVRLAVCVTEIAGKELNAKEHTLWDGRMMDNRRKELEELQQQTAEQLELTRDYYKQVVWLESRFPDAKLVDVPGLVKLVDRVEDSHNSPRTIIEM